MINCLRYAGYHSDTALLEPLMRGSQVRVPVGEEGKKIPLLTETLKTTKSMLKQQPAQASSHLTCDVNPRKTLDSSHKRQPAQASSYIVWCDPIMNCNALYERKIKVKRMANRHQIFKNLFLLGGFSWRWAAAATASCPVCPGTQGRTRAPCPGWSPCAYSPPGTTEELANNNNVVSKCRRWLFQKAGTEWICTVSSVWRGFQLLADWSELCQSW